MRDTKYRLYSEYMYHNRALLLYLDYIVNVLQKTFPGPHSTKVLDIGCGVGAIALPLAVCGYDVTAIDDDYDSIKYCSEKAKKEGLDNIRFANCRLQDLPAEMKKYDCIILSHVLEHIQNPKIFLNLLHKYLNPGAIVWVAVPNEKNAIADKVGFIFKPYSAVRNRIRSLGKKALLFFGQERTLDVLKRRLGDLSTDHNKQHFRPRYFNYSFADSPHQQSFSYQSLIDTISSAGYQIVFARGGFMFYRAWPLTYLFDRLPWLARIDCMLSKCFYRWAGSWWVLSRPII